ncbi:MAG TPA: sigma-70 family RNA polymerase sigma factor [Gemmataceae bacterium]|nr:sigma-70 family RNA polymerase sigma factor [Gemmataceae bacterium]
MSQANDLIQHLRTNGLQLRAETASDGQLLGRFLDARDESAFEALVARLGPVVWAVCKRQLPDGADAEDAFQATLLVLVRKGHTVSPRDRVANWLYGVAYMAARKVRVNRARRQDKEQRAAAMTKTVLPEATPTSDLAEHIDRELARLPDKYRAPVVLCDMQGKTRQEAARDLGWPEGTVAGRLARARGILAKRLSKFALGVSPAAIVACLSDPVSAQGPAPEIALGASKAALGLGKVSPQALTISKGVLQTMLVRKLQMVAVGVGIVVVAGLGIGGMAGKPKADAKRSVRNEPVVERPAPPTDPAVALREQLQGHWQVDSGSREGRPLTAWEKRGYTIDFDDKQIRLQRGQIHDQRTFTWAVEPAAAPKTLRLVPAEGNINSWVQVTAELKDNELTLTWNEPGGGRIGRGANPVSQLKLTRQTEGGGDQAGLAVVPAIENVVGTRLAGEWELDPELAKRLGGAATTAKLSITPDPKVASDVPEAFRPMFDGKRIYFAGKMRIVGAMDSTVPCLLVEHLGNPLLVYFLPAASDVCATEEAATVMLVPGALGKDDLLFLSPFDTAKHTPTGGYRRVVAK